jgi:2-(1,2-epoxy-1,2-dihydrophenyl)acetyl-CoA isomerase
MALLYETLKIETAESIGWLTLNRPDRQNSFGADMREELVQALLALQDDGDVKVVVVTGAGRAFCTGGDMRQMLAMKEEGAGFEKLRPLLDEGRRVVTLLHEMPKPVVAMINGPASGAGMSLALACDIRIASDHATFTQNFVHAGLHPDWGTTYFLPRLIGTGRALELMWTGRRVEAEEAEEIGLVQMVVPHPHLREHTARFARRLAKAPVTALRLIKMAVLNSLQFDIDGMFDFEVEAQQQCWEALGSADRMRSFVDRQRRI